MPRGRFISVEGIEGVGKSSNIDVVVDTLRDAGFEVLTTREPGGTPLAEDIRDILKDRGDEEIPPVAEVLLMFAARSLNVNNVILPALEAGTWVVSDRFTDSSRAYQGAGRGLAADYIDNLAEMVHGDNWPDLTILLDAPVDVGMGRASRRSNPDRFEREQFEFFERVRDCYLELAKTEADRFVVIDTTQPLDKVQKDVRSLIERFIEENLD